MVKRKRNLLTERKKYLKLTLKNVCVYANVFSVQSHISLISDCSSIPRGPVTYNVTRRTRYRTRLLYIEFANDIQKNINMNDSKDFKKRYFLRFLRTHTHTHTHLLALAQLSALGACPAVATLSSTLACLTDSDCEAGRPFTPPNVLEVSLWSTEQVSD